MADRNAADSEGEAAVSEGKTANLKGIVSEGKENATRSVDDARGSATPAEDDPALVVVCGLPGVGKTTVSRRIADRLNATILRTDAVRKELFPYPEYTDEETEAVYEELLDRAGNELEAGQTVVLDATFARTTFRENADAVADTVGVPFHLIKVECDVSVVERRIQTREGLSDADFEVHLLFREEYEPIERAHHVIDNSGDEVRTLARVDALF